MLRGLTIRDILLIEQAEIAFAPGLNVLTGETGAGKSILLDALGFALGARGRGQLARPGAGRGEVTAVFELRPDHPARAILEEAGLPAEEELVLRRLIDPDGRSRAFVNDRRAGVETLARLAATLVEVHGQQDERGLTDPRGHRALLDAYAGDDPAAPVRAAWAGLAAARRRLERRREEAAAAARDADFLAHAVEELRRLDPQPGEEAELDARRRQMQAAQRIREDVARAAEALGPRGAEGQITDAARWLDGAAAQAGGALDAALAALDRCLEALGEAQSGIEAALEAMAFDPATLEQVEERLFAIRAMARKHRVLPGELPALAGELAARLAAIEDLEADLAALEAQVARAEAAWEAAADALSATRRAAAARLDAAMAAELPPLRLERARFVTLVEPGSPGPEGRDSVTFAVATNPGASPGPIDEIASGGERARFLLALKVCLAGRGSDIAMIFDEIDRGVGGATADAIGRRLAALARGGQVLAVTHSPQVAARADHHWRIEKVVGGGATHTRVLRLDPAQRIDEIARMLAGERLTEEARAAARRLIAG